MAGFAAEAIPGPVHAVVPVPLHPARLAERGFNQAALLAEPVARALGARRVAGALRRLRQEVPQTMLQAAARRYNVAGAFAPGPNPVWGTVLLVDDVFSTGATAAACAQALAAAGAARVLVLTLARAILARNPPEIVPAGR
jgi:ComF family protein